MTGEADLHDGNSFPLDSAVAKHRIILKHLNHLLSKRHKDVWSHVVTCVLATSVAGAAFGLLSGTLSDLLAAVGAIADLAEAALLPLGLFGLLKLGAGEVR